MLNAFGYNFKRLKEQRVAFDIEKNAGNFVCFCICFDSTRDTTFMPFVFVDVSMVQHQRKCMPFMP